MTPVPVILVTGFLGSGKTTFINHVLKSHPDKKISLILNEFGDIKLESQFIEVKGMGMISELSGGCLCCVANVDLPRVIRYTVEHAPTTEYLIIEASGLSDPDPVRSTLQGSELAPIIRLDTVVAIVDADNFETTALDHPLVMSQIADADFALISKVGSHSESELNTLVSRISSIGTGTRTLIWNDQFDTMLIFDPPLPKSHNNDQSHHHVHAHYEEYWYTSEKILDLTRLGQALQSLPENILRVKGYTNHVLVQKVGHHVDLREGSAGDFEHNTAILVLGTNLEKSALMQMFDSCST